MKSVTEFPQFTLTQALKTKTTLVSEGKTAEEIEVSIGTSYKYEGDKLKHFLAAIDVAEKNPEKLKRVLVMTLGEGEAAPAKAVQVEQTCYVPEFIIDAPVKSVKKESRGGGKSRRGGSDKKSSPWGITPEEKAAKAEKAKASAQSKSN